MTAVGPTWISAAGRPSDALHQDAPRMLDAGSDTVQPARRSPQRVRDRRGARSRLARDLPRPQLHAVTALAFWNAAVHATGIDPGRHIDQHELSLRVIFGLPREQSDDRSTGTSTDLISQATVIPRSSMAEGKSRRNHLDFFAAAVAA